MKHCGKVGYIRMGDGDLMPFGKYAGYEMGDIPLDYLEFLWCMSWIGEHPNIRDYIERNKIRIEAGTGKELKEHRLRND